MRLRKHMTSAALASALIIPVSAPSYADDPADGFIQVIEAFFSAETRDDRRDRGPNRYRGERGHYQQNLLSADQAIEIARANGMTRVTGVELDDDEWEVEGYDRRGREMEVEIDARTSRVKDIDYD